MKAIIYYSLSGRTKEELEKRYEGDFYQLKGRIKIPRNYYVQLAYLGFFSALSASLDYEKFDIDLDKYDEIVLGSPVWAWTVVPFIKKFLKRNRFKNKKVSFLITHEGGPKKAMMRFAKYVDKSNIVNDITSVELGSAYKEANYYRKTKSK
jgi:menaquinone-dependent protoporphyrinogen IX oxidase